MSPKPRAPGLSSAVIPEQGGDNELPEQSQKRQEGVLGHPGGSSRMWGQRQGWRRGFSRGARTIQKTELETGTPVIGLREGQKGQNVRSVDGARGAPRRGCIWGVYRGDCTGC